MIELKWGIIVSLADFSDEIVNEMKEFGDWLIDMLENHSNLHVLLHHFDENSSFCIHSAPGNKAAIHKAYDQVYRQYPNVIFVLHILPERDSIEFNLMKTLTTNYALIGQGVLIDNARNKFEGLNLPNVMGKMNQYIMRRMFQIVTFQRYENKYKLLVHDGREVSNGKMLKDWEVEKCVEIVLHSSAKSDREDKSCDSPRSFEHSLTTSGALIVEGFPSKYNKFQVASFFLHPAFRPLFVTLINEQCASVEFANNFHAVQAGLHYFSDRNTLDANEKMGVRLTIRCADTLANKHFEQHLQRMKKSGAEMAKSEG